MARILIVDDEQAMREYMRRVLEKHGHTVHSAKSPSDAVAALSEARFDALLLDIEMPEMDGLTFTRLLTKNPQILGPHDVPILLVTGRDNPGTMGDGFAAGARFFVRKPFSPNELLSAVNLVTNTETTT